MLCDFFIIEVASLEQQRTVLALVHLTKIGHMPSLDMFAFFSTIRQCRAILELTLEELVCDGPQKLSIFHAVGIHL